MRNRKTPTAELRAAGCLLLLALGAVQCRLDPRVILVNGSGQEVVVRVEVADTPSKRALGLQYRSELGESRGMLFLFPSEKVQAFWMKDTPLSLDLIFIGSDRRIAGIVPRAVPFSMETLSVNAPSQFVLEVEAGFSSRHGIRAGDPVRFEGVTLQTVRE